MDQISRLGSVIPIACQETARCLS